MGALLDQPGPHPGVIAKVPDRLGRHEADPQQDQFGQPGQPHRIQSVLGRPAAAPGRIAGPFQQRVQHSVIRQLPQRHPPGSGNGPGPPAGALPSPR